jgi:tetratricopeptide (TPR) repeat protein
MSSLQRSIVLLLALLASSPLACAQQAKPGGEETYDPLHAQEAVEIGKFYMRRGDVDAAIDRFKEAIHLNPNFALPRLLLGEAYEKKGEKAEAVKYYEEYLKMLPKAPDAKKVRKKMEKLRRQLEEDQAGARAGSDKALEEPPGAFEMRKPRFLAAELG